MPLKLEDIARIPAEGDNVVIATRRLDAGTVIDDDGASRVAGHTILEGHRFARCRIGRDEPLLSWGLPFGRALRDIEAGEYLCNEKILDVLAGRDLDIDLPDGPNFVNVYETFDLDTAGVHDGEQVAADGQSFTFEGYDRGSRRGVGTRNTIALIGTASLTGSYVHALAERFREATARHPDLDGVVAIAHTEGGAGPPNNLDMVLRALAGFVVHPNVAAALIGDFDDEPVNNRALRQFMEANDYPLGDLPHRFLSLDPRSNLQSWLDAGAEAVTCWLEPVGRAARTPQPASALRLAMQCGGSDAFSGISANPLVGRMARRLIQCGGSANLAETDELIGAEQYVLANVRDAATARAFLDRVERFKQRAARHGHSAEGNPSGGNYYRGLYNIVVKSIGAARKKDPQVRLDHVIDYAQRMDTPGFYFMDSPGNDLESVAGQVASGANLIVFTTGNGSITNFPFVPTIKVVTTTERYRLIPREMDVNAGRYLDGEPMDDLGRETFDLALRIASGERSAGERAGHAQVQLWRDWRQTAPDRHHAIAARPARTGAPLEVQAPPDGGDLTFRAIRSDRGYATDRVAAVAPTSLCAGQIARLIVDRLNATGAHRPAVSRFVTFTHTEGCGVSGGHNMDAFLRTLVGHMAHPMVHRGLFLEHGCEHTHNDTVRRSVAGHGLDPDDFGWASVQLDGGIESVTDKVSRWFESALRDADAERVNAVGLERLRIGVTSVGVVPDETADAFARLAGTIVGGGGLFVIAGNATLWDQTRFRARLGLGDDVEPTLDYGQTARQAGMHVMDAPTDHVMETLTGLGATGVEVMLGHVAERSLQAHPMVPLIQATTGSVLDDADEILDAGSSAQNRAERLLQRVLNVASRDYRPKLSERGYSDFQVSRGLLGISL
ncbi:MAG: altronate hydrolase [Phycisphaeraceae bacterium]|nr:altronate hydrolase [Phycisphaeraceae bacterium]